MLFAVAVPGEGLGLGDGLGEGTASCAITKVALLRSAKVKVVNLFKVFSPGDKIGLTMEWARHKGVTA